MRPIRCLQSTLLLATLLFGAPALAEEPSQPVTHHSRQTWQQHFAEANKAHDGHLTLEEAKSGFPLLAKHFDDIDVDHKGYVTRDNVRTWRAMRKAARRLAHPPDDTLKPNPAYQRQFPNRIPPTARWSAMRSGDSLV